MITPTQIQIKLDKGHHGNVIRVTLTNPLKKTIVATITQKTDFTAAISVLTGETSPGIQTVDFNTTRLNALTPLKAYVYNVLSPETLIEVDSLSFPASNSFSLTSTFSSGMYGFKV